MIAVIRSSREMAVTLRTLELGYGVDISGAVGLAGAELQAWLEQTEERLFQQSFDDLFAIRKATDEGDSQ